MDDYIYIYNNGDHYEGEWNQKFQRHGRGKYLFQNGDIYEGEWNEDAKHGAGKYKFHDGKIMSGYFENDKYNGENVPVKKKHSSVVQIYKQAKRIVSSEKVNKEERPAKYLSRDVTDGLIQFNRYYGLNESDKERKKREDEVKRVEYEERKAMHNIRVKEMRDKYLKNIKK